MEDTNYLMIMSTQSYWNLRINSVNPCDTAMLPHHQPVRELCELIPYPATLLPHLAFKNAFLKVVWELRGFEP